MQRFDTVLTEEGQVTLPDEVRRILGVRPHEWITFEVEGDQVRIVPATLTVESARGSVPALREQRPLEEIYEIAGEEHARHVLDEMNASSA